MAINDYIRRLVDSAPPLTAAQRDRLTLLLGGGGLIADRVGEENRKRAAEIEEQHKTAIREDAIKRNRAKAERAFRTTVEILSKAKDAAAPRPIDPVMELAEEFFASPGMAAEGWEHCYRNAQACIESEKVYARQRAEAHANGDHWRCHFAECLGAERPSAEDLAEDEAECRLSGHLLSRTKPFCIRCGSRAVKP